MAGHHWLPLTILASTGSHWLTFQTALAVQPWNRSHRTQASNSSTITACMSVAVICVFWAVTYQQAMFKSSCHISPSLRLGRGQLVHTALSLAFCNLMEDPTVSFMTSNTRVCLRASLGVLLPPRSSCCLIAAVCYPVDKCRTCFPMTIVLG
jgi:hypothetical protein